MKTSEEWFKKNLNTFNRIPNIEIVKIWVDSAWSAAIAERDNEMCEWEDDTAGGFDTQCGHSYIFIDGGPKENDQIFCGYCGKRIKLKESEARK